MAYDVTEVMTLLDKKKKLAKQLDKLNQEYAALTIDIESVCPHPTTIKDSHYSRGGYDYVSSVTITIRCSICNKTLKSYDDPKHMGTHS